MNTCGVCFESFNRSSRKRIECHTCRLQCCRACVSTYICSSAAPAQCMGCRSDWSRQFLAGVMTKRWMTNEYRQHREKVLFEQETARMPGDLPFLQSRKRKFALMDERQDLLRSLDELRARLDRNSVDISSEDRFFCHGKRRKEAPEEERVAGHCVRADCNGLVDASKFRCCSCELEVCRRCMRERAADHACDENDLRSVALIRRDSRPCPGCSAPIHRIDGCAQMFCTQCNTAFDWNSLQVIRNGFFHNPHFAEFMARSGMRPGGVANVAAFAEQGCVNFADIARRVQEEVPEQEDEAKFRRVAARMRGYLVAANHIMAYETGRRDEDREKQLRFARVMYMNNEIGRDAFIDKIQRVDKSWRKQGEKAQVFEMYSTVCRDILARWAVHREISYVQTKEEIARLYRYTLESLRQIQQWYCPNSCSSIVFNNCWA